MKEKIIITLIVIVSLFSCKKGFHGISAMHELLYSDLSPTRHHIFEMNMFNKGFYVYENCSSLKKIDGVWVNWIEEENECDYLLNLEVEKNTEKLRDDNMRNMCLDSLLDKKEFKSIELPQRFFLVFLDKRRVLYFTNYEAKKFFEKNIASIYEEVGKNEELENNNLQKILNQHFKKEKYSPQNLTFANFNWNHWKDSLTHNRTIPLDIWNIDNPQWRNYMIGVYQTYLGDNGDFKLKIAFNESAVKIDKLNDTALEGIIELDFIINPNTQNLSLSKVNLPDRNINIDGALSKGGLRRDLFINEILAIQPSFKFHEEPVQFVIPYDKKQYPIDSVFLSTPKYEDWKSLKNYSAVWHSEGKVFDEKNFKKETFWGEFFLR